jgi:hypothetical protein
VRQLFHGAAVHSTLPGVYDALRIYATGSFPVASSFHKKFIRLHTDRFRSLSSKYHKAGMVFAFGQVLVILSMMRWMFHFTFSPAMYGFAYLYILAFYFYYTEMIDLYQA